MIPPNRSGVAPSHRRKIAILTLLLGGSLLLFGYKVSLFRHPVSPVSASSAPTSFEPAFVGPTLAGTANAATSTATPQRTIPQMLQDINSRLDPDKFPYMNARRATRMRDLLDSQAAYMPQDKLLETDLKYAVELLNAGKTQEAFEEFSQIEQHLKGESPATWSQIGTDLLIMKAVCSLRLGEVENCCDRNNANSCLLPISGSGVHTKQAGSRGAVTSLLEALNAAPDNTFARWLLNIAYMTLGEYPKHVPARWLIPFKNYGGEYPMKKFFNAAPKMGLDLLGWAGSVAMEDFEGNGLLDLFISSWHREGQLRYFHNNGNGTFTERTKEAGLIGEVNSLNLITTDYNNDGRPDLVILRGGWLGPQGHYPLSLLRNDGNGHFTDVTLQAGLLTSGPTQTAVAFDYNGDGWLDLFVGYESTPKDPVPSKLFRNNGDGTFTDVTQQCGLDVVRFVKAAVSSDFTHNGRPGLYISCIKGHNILLRNDGPAGADKSPTAAWKFTDVSHQAGVDLQDSSFSCFFFDYDNDGWPDLYVGGYGKIDNVGDIANDYLGLPTSAEKTKLYHNNHDGTFTDVSQQTHLNKVILGMGINFGDLDNDGWLDFYAGTGNPDLGTLVPNRMFRNNNGKFFDEVTTTGDFGHLQKGHGIAFGDINNNGQQDIFLVAGGAYEGDTAHDCLFINPGSKNHWVNLTLTGVTSNRVALGARIDVTVATPQGDRHLYRTVSTGGSFGNNPFRQAIGLGNATEIKQVTIDWPASGIRQTVKNLSMDRFYKIREGNPNAQVWKVPTFTLPSN